MAANDFLFALLLSCMVTRIGCKVPLGAICPKFETYQSSIRQPYTASRVERYTTRCFSIPPVCTRYRTYYYTGYALAYETKVRTTYECCKGYQNISSICTPICQDDCSKHGKCISPNQCLCDAGWSGASCASPIKRKDEMGGISRNNFEHPERLYKARRESAKSCSSEKHGTNCCKCKNSGKCNPVTGECSCSPGFTGNDCERNCPIGTFGDQCSGLCQCLNGADCDNVDGECLCAPGYTGTYCEKKCEPGYYGSKCDFKCNCNSYTTEYCDPISGECKCLPGWKGHSCETLCEDGTWGPTCNETCPCREDIMCHPVTGKCVCEPGFMGYSCSESCELGTWGHFCESKCDCVQDDLCDSATGVCHCPPGWTGTDCSECKTSSFLGGLISIEHV